MFEVNEIELNRLLDTLGTIVRSYTILLQMNNSEWFDLYWDNRREHQEEKIYYKKERISRKNKDKKAKNRVGRPGKFSSLIEFQKKLESLPNWKSLSKTELAKKLGYKSLSGLNELLKTNEWSLPK